MFDFYRRKVRVVIFYVRGRELRRRLWRGVLALVHYAFRWITVVASRVEQPSAGREMTSVDLTFLM